MPDKPDIQHHIDRAAAELVEIDRMLGNVPPSARDMPSAYADVPTFTSDSATYTQLGEVRFTQGLEEPVTRAERACIAELFLLRAALKECADELSDWVTGHYMGMLHYPSEKRRYDRDMEPVLRARTLLARGSDPDPDELPPNATPQEVNAYRARMRR